MLAMLITGITIWGTPTPTLAAGPFACTDTVRIMPTGDSLTQGYASGVEDIGDQIAYRKTLYDNLVAQGRQFDFVGLYSAGYNYVGFDADHTGIPGENVQQVEVNIYDWLEATTPDIVLLHIGTNNVNPSFVNNYNRLLNEIDTYEAVYGTEVTVVVALIINRITSGDPLQIARTIEFNDGLETLVNNRIANGDDLILVDMEHDAGIIYEYEADGGDFFDADAAGIHPVASGYNKMAAVWEATLLPLLPDCSDTPPTANAGPDQTVVDTDDNGGEILFLDGRASTDSDGSIVHYSWAINGTEITIGDLASYNFAVGTYSVTLTVTDNDGATDTDEVNITVVAAPPEATLQGTLSLQGRSDYSGNVTVDVYDSSMLVTSKPATVDASGNFAVSGLPVGYYEMVVIAPTYLQAVEAATLVEGTNSVTFGMLLAGDANADNLVSALDFSLLASAYNLSEGQAGYDEHADFNDDGLVSALDFSLLASNYNVAGENPSE